jgi:PDZ domain
MDRYSNASCVRVGLGGHCPTMKRAVKVLPLSMPLFLLLVVLPARTMAWFATRPLTALVGGSGGQSLSLQRLRLLRTQLVLHQAPSTTTTTTEATLVAPAAETTKTATTSMDNRLESWLHPPANGATTSNQPAPVTLVNVTLTKHRPLGCVVEESVAITNAVQHLVFVASVSPNGHAATAGINVGDVIVGVSGLFGPVECVLGQGIDIVYVYRNTCPLMCWIVQQKVYERIHSHILHGSLNVVHCTIAASHWCPVAPIRNPCSCNCCAARRS